MASVSEMITQAMQHHRAEQLGQAESMYREVLKREPCNHNALHLLGLIAHQQGQYEQAIDYINRAIKEKNDSALYLSNLGASLLALGRLEEAERPLRKSCKLKADYLPAFHNLGHVLRMLKKTSEAAEIYRKVLSLDAKHLEARIFLGISLRDLGKLEEAVDELWRAFALDNDNVTVNRILGGLLLAQGLFEQARDCLLFALEAGDNNADTQNNLGNVNRELGFSDQAVACYRQALKIDPNLHEVWANLGTAYKEREEIDKAIDCFQRSLSISQDNILAWAKLADLFEKVNRLEEARNAANRGLNISREDSTCNLVLAKCDRREGNIQAALTRLEKLENQAETSTLGKELYFELTTLCDRDNRESRAFQYALRGNQLAVRENPQFSSSEGANRSIEEINRLYQFFEKKSTSLWTEDVASPDMKTPVFLIGFPRSGTTLLEVALDNHPDVQTLQEKPTLYSLRREVDNFEGGYPEAIARLNPAEIKRLQELYFETVDLHLKRDIGKILIDKLPLNTMHVGLILRVFPQAKFIMAVRHPMDVCLSCFMQDFELNDSMVNFITIEETAVFYDKVMRLWNLYRQVSPHQYHLVKYEDMVDDVSTQTESILEFLGLPWNSAILDYTENAQRRIRIDTPSYHQVTEPIYQRSKYRWQRYAEQLAPVQEILSPYIKEFGYQDLELHRFVNEN